MSNLSWILKLRMRQDLSVCSRSVRWRFTQELPMVSKQKQIILYLIIWAVTHDFQQCAILTSVDSDEPLQPPFKLRNSKWASVSILTVIEYSSDQQRLWSVCAYAQAGLSHCWSHIPHCWKSHAMDQLYFVVHCL